MDSTRVRYSGWVTAWRYKYRWVNVALVVAILLSGTVAWALVGRSTNAMHWYAGAIHYGDFEEAKNYFVGIVPPRQRLVFNNLYLNSTYGIHNVCGELNSQRTDGGYTGFLLFYVEIVDGSPEKSGVVMPNFDAAKTAEWQAHCGDGENASLLSRERFYRNLLTTEALLKRWSAEQENK